MEELHPKLEHLKLVNSRHEHSERVFTQAVADWYTWNNWARKNKRFYDLWTDRHKLRPSQIGAYKHLSDDTVLEEDKGWGYYEAYVNARKIKDDLRSDLDAAIVDVRTPRRRTKLNKRQKYQFTIYQIADCLGRSVGATQKLIEDNPMLN